MNRVRYILLFCLLLCSAALSAQTYEQAMRRHVWSTSENVNGMRHDTVSVSYAELRGTYETGRFRDTWQPRRAWTAGAATATVRHLDNMTLVGGFSFTQTEGYEQCGSMFIEPGYFPVDVMEFTPGRKTLQTYRFNGGLSYDYTYDLKFGAMMDYEASNIAKRKDLRHSNSHLDMTISPGLTWVERESGIVLGVNYVFRKLSETVKPELVGSKETSYHAFLDKGMMYGVYSVWSGSGLHLDEAGVNGFPVKELHSGLAFQLQYRDFYAEVQFDRFTGTVGEKDFIWFRYPGMELSAHAGYKFRTGDVAHYTRLEYGWKDMDMNESVLEKITEGGVTNVHNHGTNRILSTADWYLRPEYEYVSDVFDILAKMNLEGSHSVSSQMYPYVYKGGLVTWSLGAEAKFYLGNVDWSFWKFLDFLNWYDFSGWELDAGFRYRGGASAERGRLVADATGVQTQPFRLQEYYDMQMEYAKASAIGINLALRYSFWKGLYVKASGDWLCALALRHIPGHFRTTATLSFGYDF